MGRSVSSFGSEGEEILPEKEPGQEQWKLREMMGAKKRGGGWKKKKNMGNPGPPVINLGRLFSRRNPFLLLPPSHWK